MGTFCCHGNQSWSNLPQNLMQPFPHPNDTTHKILSRLATWLLRTSSKVWNFRHSRASNSKMSGLILSKIKLARAFMSVLVTSNFDDDSVKNEHASMETPFSHYKSYGKFLDSRAANSVVSGPIWLKVELVRDFMHVLVTCKYKKGSDQKQPRKGGDTIFPNISQWGLSGSGLGDAIKRFLQCWVKVKYWFYRSPLVDGPESFSGGHI